MVFWMSDNTRKVKDDLKNICKKLKNIKEEKKAEELVKRVQTIISNLNAVKNEIIKEGEKQKTKAHIDSRFDAVIDALVKDEITNAKKLQEDLTMLANRTINGDEVKSIAELVRTEGATLLERDGQNQNKIEDMERETLRERIRIESPTIQPRTVKDGTSWSNICYVARQLGCRIEESTGTHQIKIIFPNIYKPGETIKVVPLSGTVNLKRLADQIIEQLPACLPAHKIPENKFLVSAFKIGDILKAA